MDLEGGKEKAQTWTRMNESKDLKGFHILRR